MPGHPQISDEGKPSSHTVRVDVAARYLVYNLFISIGETSETSKLLCDFAERTETLARAVKRGWVEVFERRQEGGEVVRVVALTDEGRRMVRGCLH